MATATMVLDQPVGWAEGTKLYQCSDGRWLAVEATEPSSAVLDTETGDLIVQKHPAVSALKIVVRQTVVFLSNERGEPVDSDENDHDPLTPLRVFPAGLSHEDALAAMGYELT